MSYRWSYTSYRFKELHRRRRPTEVERLMWEEDAVEMLRGAAADGNELGASHTPAGSAVGPREEVELHAYYRWISSSENRSQTLHYNLR